MLAAEKTRRAERGGYTLVEMLVAAGLVVVLMTLFATIFQMATHAMSVQRGMAANDQKVRLVQTLLRNDLNGDKFDKVDPTMARTYRTFRNMLPYGAGENGQPNFNETDRCGYFYFSENDPLDDTDDVLQLTVATPDTSADRFYGRVATVLPNDDDEYCRGNGLGIGQGNELGNLLHALLPAIPAPGSYWPNQPEFDDLQGIPNGVGSSSLAEVAYFIRNGALYRRDADPPAECNHSPQ